MDVQSGGCCTLAAITDTDGRPTGARRPEAEVVSLRADAYSGDRCHVERDVEHALALAA
jgi:hypothetical protein